MSCTENESGPFVVFFLPAVIGCLTILLARRWANSQVANTSSTAISRRRKIIKDPLIKRPLPPIACKMVAPSSKKGAGVTKKGVPNITEDEICSNGRRSGRATRITSNPAPMPEPKLSDGPVPPKHIPFPYIPQDGELLFEVMTFVFTLVATALQFLNLYRTAWWLPYSHTNQAMNFHLIDPHIVAFIVTILSRRLLFSVSLAVLRALLTPKVMPHVVAATRMFILGVILGALVWCTYFIMLKYPIGKIFYLCYPAVVYFGLFGLEPGPFLESSGAAPLHCCSQDPEQIRSEVETLRLDFNERVKKILFNSVVGAYYSSFIPLCFAQSYLYYDVYACAQQVALSWGALAGRCAARALPATALDAPHRAALHLGKWVPAATMAAATGNGHDPLSDAGSWLPSRLYRRGARVGVDGVVLTADAACVAATPRDKHHARFYAVFINPSLLLCMMLCLQLSLVALQICLLFSNTAWHNFLSIVMLLFINYYTLFKFFRDYLVAWKVYKAENMIQDKNGSVHLVGH